MEGQGGPFPSRREPIHLCNKYLSWLGVQVWSWTLKSKVAFVQFPFGMYLHRVSGMRFQGLRQQKQLCSLSLYLLAVQLWASGLTCLVLFWPFSQMQEVSLPHSLFSSLLPHIHTLWWLYDTCMWRLCSRHSRMLMLVTIWVAVFLAGKWGLLLPPSRVSQWVKKENPRLSVNHCPFLPGLGSTCPYPSRGLKPA